MMSYLISKQFRSGPKQNKELAVGLSTGEQALRAH